MNGKSNSRAPAARRSASIELLDSSRSASCVIRRLSDVDAVLEVAEPDGLPIEFDLSIEPGQPQRCCIIRRGARSVAVAFI